jgi:serine/threonine protein kinase
VSRFEQEADFLAGLDHPNIVAMRGHFVAYKTRFIVLDLYDGMDLRQLLRDQGPLDEATAKGILGQIADGLRYAHKQGVLHLDLKPANVLINQQGQIAITDFGLSKLMESDGCESEAVGTPLYMPPEQFTMTDVGPHSDHYALGCLAYELLAGKNPFAGAADDLDLFDLKQRAPSSKWPRLEASDEYRKLVRSAIQPSTTKRKMDLEAIASWARAVPQCFDRRNRRPR